MPLVLLAALALNLNGSAAEPLPGAKRVLILGDSITAAGHYTAYLEGYFATQYPERRIEFLNLGLPSETISGLSEPSHPWPRPNVHERLERAMTKLKPDVVVACYGMNDGIYHPFDEGRFAKYREGVGALIARCRADKIPLYLITPPPFDPEPLREKLKPASAKEHGWLGPYDRYQEDVLARYAAWIKEQNGPGVTTIDAQGPILDFLRAERIDRKHPDYRFAGDGVHMNADGHWLIARAILAKWLGGAIPSPEVAAIDAASLRATEGDASDIRREAGGVRFSVRSKLPMPRDPEWSDSLREHGGLPTGRITVSGLRDGRYTLYEGPRAVGSVEAKDGRAAIDLGAFRELSINRNADEVGALIRKRERILSPAWRDWVGHKRPDTDKGLALDAAKTQAQPLTTEVRRLAAPATIELRLVAQ